MTDVKMLPIGDLSGTQTNRYGVVSTVTSIPVPSPATLKYTITNAKHKKYIRLNNTLKALTADNPKLTIGDMLVMHSKSPLRDATMKCITDAILLINNAIGNPVDESHKEYDKLMNDLMSLDNKNKSHVRKQHKMDSRVVAAMKQIKTYPGDPELTIGLLLKIDAVMNQKQVQSYVPDIKHLLRIVAVVKDIQDRDPNKTLQSLLNLDKSTVNLKKPNRPPGKSIGDLINSAAIEKYGKPLTKKTTSANKTQPHRYQSI